MHVVYATSELYQLVSTAKFRFCVHLGKLYANSELYQLVLAPKFLFCVRLGKLYANSELYGIRLSAGVRNPGGAKHVCNNAWPLLCFTYNNVGETYVVTLVRHGLACVRRPRRCRFAPVLYV